MRPRYVEEVRRVRMSIPGPVKINVPADADPFETRMAVRAKKRGRLRLLRTVRRDDLVVLPG